MKTNNSVLNKKSRERMRLRIKQRLRQKAFKNKEISFNTIKKRYEKYKLQPKIKPQLPQE
jgi:hypothetical protein